MGKLTAEQRQFLARVERAMLEDPNAAVILAVVAPHEAGGHTVDLEGANANAVDLLLVADTLLEEAAADFKGDTGPDAAELVRRIAAARATMDISAPVRMEKGGPDSAPPRGNLH